MGNEFFSASGDRKMRVFVQMICVLAIATGAGLLGFSNKYQLAFNPADPATLTRMELSYADREQLAIASITGGLGTGLMLLGTLGLVTMWINKIGTAMNGDLGDNSARTIGLITIWLSIATILTFGVFRLNWTGGSGLGVVLIAVALTSAAATISTAFVSGWRPWARNAAVVVDSGEKKLS
jgi:hypothetical protein